MDLVNHTPFAARLMPYGKADGTIQTTIVVKATYDWAPDGTLTPSEEQMPIVGELLETPFGVFHSDHFVKKSGVDLCVLATVRRAHPVTETEVAVTAGNQVRRLRLTGPRQWVRAGGLLVPSAPVPFTEMPLAYTHTYGGQSVYNHESVTYSDNPSGVGYYITEDQAVGHPLPCIERADGPRITRWDEQHEPAGWGPYPMFWGMRARAGVTPVGTVETPTMPDIHPVLNNNAHPDLVLPELWPGDVIRLDGVSATHHTVAVPNDVLYLEAHVGEDAYRSVGMPDGVFLFVDAARLVVTYRVHVTYPFRRGEVRRAHLAMDPAPPPGGGFDAFSEADTNRYSDPFGNEATTRYAGPIDTLPGGTRDARNR